MKAFIKKYPFLVISLTIGTIVAIVLFVTALSLKDTTEIEIRVAPISATILIDGKSYQNGTFRIPSGTHNIKIEKPGFTTKEFVFDTNTSDKLYTYLVETDGGYNWYLSHKEDSLLLTSIGDYESNINSENYTKKYPVVQILPIIYANYDKEYNYTEYRIDGGSFSDCKTDFCLKITDTTGGNYSSALQKIKDGGFNPDDYQILYEYKPIK